MLSLSLVLVADSDYFAFFLLERFSDIEVMDVGHDVKTNQTVNDGVAHFKIWTSLPDTVWKKSVIGCFIK